jgi:uncharacterized protein with PQ loop repeat
MEFVSWLELANGSNHTGKNSSCPGAAKLHAEWVQVAFGECVDTPLKYVAFFIGLSSILCWLVAQAPQLVTNCRLGIADKALSFWFLLQWFLGDATNLIGALLTKQLPSQIITAVYFCLIDTVMMTQYLYYVVRNQGWRGLPRIFLCPKNTGSQAAAIFIPGLACTILLTSWAHFSDLFSLSSSSSSSSASYLDPASSSPGGRVLLGLRDNSSDHIDWNNTEFLVGYIIGCVSAVFYLGSRLPQIIQNFSRCSVKGVSLPMFILAVMGNVTYSLGIFLYSMDGDFLIQKTPWLVGSIGTLCFDFTIFTQFIVYDCFGKRCRGDGNEKHQGVSSEEERAPLITATDRESGLPCFSDKGSIQGDGYHDSDEESADRRNRKGCRSYGNDISNS